MTGPNSMTTAQTRAFRDRLRRLRRMLSAMLSEECCESPVTLAQCDVLLEAEGADRVTLAWLADRLGLDRSTLSRTVDALVEKGLLSREPDPDDRRYNVLALTAEGRRRCDEINAEGDKSAALLTGRIPAARRAAAVRGFNAVVDAMIAVCEEECGCEEGGEKQ